MRQTATGILLSVVCVFWFSTGAVGSEVHWTAAHELAPSGLTGILAAGDLDGDGDDDVSHPWDQYWSVGCPGPPAWELEEDVFPDISGCMEMSITLGDCDADGDLDLIYSCWKCCSLYMFWNVGTPQVPEWEYGGAIPGDPNSGNDARVELCDLDADGDLDLIVTCASGTIGVYENTGTPDAPYWVWLDFIPVIGFGQGGQLAVDDLDGDGDLDIVGGLPHSGVMCWENTGTPQEWSYIRNDAMLAGIDAPTDGVWGLALPDVDCDGDCDLVIVGWNGAAYMYLNDRFTSTESGSWGAIKALFTEPAGQVSPN